MGFYSLSTFGRAHVEAQHIEALATTGRPHADSRETPEKAEITVEDKMRGIDKIDHPLSSLRFG